MFLRLVPILGLQELLLASVINFFLGTIQRHLRLMSLGVAFRGCKARDNERLYTGGQTETHEHKQMYKTETGLNSAPYYHNVGYVVEL